MNLQKNVINHGFVPINVCQSIPAHIPLCDTCCYILLEKQVGFQEISDAVIANRIALYPPKGKMSVRYIMQYDSVC